MDDAVRQRLASFLADRNIDMKAASLRAGLGETYVRDVIQRGRGKLDLVQRIVATIDPSAVSFVLGGTEPRTQGTIRPPPPLLGERDLKVFASAECGPGEMTVYSNEPYEIVPRPWFVQGDPDAYGVVLTGDSMEPIYEAGEIVIVSPRSPLVKGKEAIFIADPEGEFRASLKRYRGQTETTYLAKQFHPEKDIEFDRKIWMRAHRVVGTFDG